MAVVHFLRMNCRDTQETFSDEPYLKFDGRHVGGPWGDFDEGETQNIDASFTFNGRGLVELFDPIRLTPTISSLPS